MPATLTLKNIQAVNFYIKKNIQPAMDSLKEIDTNPDILIQIGLERRDEETTDTSSLIWYEKIIQPYNSHYQYRIQVEFDLFISDEPFVSHSENYDYSFNGVYLLILSTELEDYSSLSNKYINNIEFDRIELNIMQISQLIAFIKSMDK